MNWYFEVLRKYAVFDGRARRQEYWMFSLINILISLAIAFGAGSVGGMRGAGGHAITTLAAVYSLAIVIPSLAVWVRRMHDVGRSGWWILIAVVPIIGVLTLLVFSLQDSEPGTNAYGENPKTSFA